MSTSFSDTYPRVTWGYLCKNTTKMHFYTKKIQTLISFGQADKSPIQLGATEDIRILFFSLVPYPKKWSFGFLTVPHLFLIMYYEFVCEFADY